MTLYDVIARLKSASEVEALFEDICTPAERKAMQERWNILLCLQKGMSYRDIEKALSVSTTTVTRVARAWREGQGYRHCLEHVMGHPSKG